MSARILYRAGEVAGFDPAGGWPAELEYSQLVALLTADAPGPWAAMLTDAVRAGKLEARKDGWLSYWFHTGGIIHRANTVERDLMPDEIDLLEAERGNAEHTRIEKCRIHVCLHDEPKTTIAGAYRPGIEPEHYDNAVIRWHFARPAVSAWLQSIGEQAGPLIAGWIGEAAKVGAGGTAKDGEPTLTERRIAAILETAGALDYPLMAIPWGGKAKIERECLGTKAKAPYSFTPATFEAAWKAASKRGVIEVQDKITYLGDRAGKPHGY